MGFIAFKLDPSQRELELAQQLSRPGDNNIHQDLFDLSLLRRSGILPPPGSHNDLLSWLSHFAGKDYDYNLREWQTSKSLPWLLAALTAAQPHSPGVAAIEQVAAAQPAESPAHDSLQFQVLRLAFLEGRAAVVQSEAAAAAAHPGLAPATRNQYLALQFGSAQNLDQALAAASRTDSQTGRVGLDSDALVFFNGAAPLSMLAYAADDSSLPADLRTGLLIAAWTRAMVLQEHRTNLTELQISLSRSLAESVPALAPYLAAYMKAGYFERDFEAAWLLLHFPGMSPYVELQTDYFGKPRALSVLNDAGENWWGSPNVFALPQPLTPEYSPGAVALLYPHGFRPPAFIAVAQLLEGESEMAALQRVPAADLLCDWVLVQAQRHPDDPRLPEALALAVRATGAGWGDESTAHESE
ncbi:MAG: hypothetical protein ACRD2D_01620, partial [Terriglobales bacterium]